MSRNISLAKSWYDVQEDFLEDGSIKLAIRDKRSNELVTLNLDLEDYNALIDFLNENRNVGTLSSLAVASGN